MKTEMELTLREFIRESNQIEGIYRPPTQDEVEALGAFLALPEITVDELGKLQAVFAPGKPLRAKIGMNMIVGFYRPPSGGPDIESELERILLNRGHRSPYKTHVEFERLHPYLDGNGRVGRALWAWQMNRTGERPFALPFLHRFYYQTLAEARL